MLMVDVSEQEPIYCSEECEEAVQKALSAPIVVCGCCGNLIPDLQEFNVYYGMIPYPADAGYGMCAPCLEFAETIVLQP